MKLLYLVLFCLGQDLVRAECDAECRKLCLELHNKYRRNHQAPDLVLDDELNQQAQQWADNNSTAASSSWATSGGGECWAWGTLYPTWTDVVKEWHDQELHIDWKTKKSKDGNQVYCFSQIVWKSATKLGCGKGEIKSAPFYVAQIDKAAVVVDGMIDFEPENIGRPKTQDIHWFDNVTITGASPNATAPEFRYERVADKGKKTPDFTWGRGKDDT